MDRRTAQLEDLPPLALEPLRDLDLTEASGPASEAYMAAASGVVRRGDRVYVIGDDELHMGVFRLTDPGPGTLRRVLDGELPATAEDRRKHKADLEALTLLPPFEDHPFGALFGLGSGSGEGRDRGFVWALAADGSLSDDPREIDLGPVYGLLRKQISELNIEGAAVMGDRLWLLQRGNTDDGRNIVAELSLEQVMNSLRRDLTIDADELLALSSYDLGELDGIPLTFSDGTPVGRELLLFTASAEADDGIRGSVVGSIALDGSVHRLRTIDRQYKVEGIHASLDTGVVDLLFVCDQDDDSSPSPLLSAAMPLDAQIEADHRRSNP